MSTKVSVETSPETTTRPVLTSVSHATRPVGSSRMTASSTPSEIWSATLSGWPSVTDSDVKRYSLSANLLIAGAPGRGGDGACSQIRQACHRVQVADPLVQLAGRQPGDAICPELLDVERRERGAPRHRAPQRVLVADVVEVTWERAHQPTCRNVPQR